MSASVRVHGNKPERLHEGTKPVDHDWVEPVLPEMAGQIVSDQDGRIGGVSGDVASQHKVVIFNWMMGQQERKALMGRPV